MEQKKLVASYAEKRSYQRHYKHHKQHEIRHKYIILHDKRIDILVDTKLETRLIFTIRKFYCSIVSIPVWLNVDFFLNGFVFDPLRLPTNPGSPCFFDDRIRNGWKYIEALVATMR